MFDPWPPELFPSLIRCVEGGAGEHFLTCPQMFPWLLTVEVKESRHFLFITHPCAQYIQHSSLQNQQKGIFYVKCSCRISLLWDLMYNRQELAGDWQECVYYNLSPVTSLCFMSFEAVFWYVAVSCSTTQSNAVLVPTSQLKTTPDWHTAGLWSQRQASVLHTPSVSVCTTFTRMTVVIVGSMIHICLSNFLCDWTRPHCSTCNMNCTRLSTLFRNIFFYDILMIIVAACVFLLQHWGPFSKVYHRFLQY